MNGVIRSEALKDTPLMIPFFGSDNCLMCELALHGKFTEIPEYLFYRQMDETSSTSMQDEATRIEHYQPNSTKPMRFQNWKVYLYYFAASHRAQLSANELIAIHKEIFRRMFWHKNKLIRDPLLPCFGSRLQFEDLLGGRPGRGTRSRDPLGTFQKPLGAKSGRENITQVLP